MVRIIVTDHKDPRPVEDIVWSDADDSTVYSAAGLELLETHRPTVRTDEPFPWINRTRIATRVISVFTRMEV